MHITYAPRGILQIDDAIIIFKNFAGTGSKFNREGDRNFAIVIEDQETADQLIGLGWNVRIKPPREDGEDPFMYLPVKIKFTDFGPVVYLKTGNAVNKLDEESIECLDNIEILEANLDVRPYDWGPVNGKYGRTAYLQGGEIIQKIDRFAMKYTEE